MALPTFFWAFLPYLRPALELLLDDDERERLDFFLAEVDRDVPRGEDLLLPVLRRLLLLFLAPCELELRRVELDFRAVAIKFWSPPSVRRAPVQIWLCQSIYMQPSASAVSTLTVPFQFT
jgi:hypothetical protein